MTYPRLSTELNGDSMRLSYDWDPVATFIRQLIAAGLDLQLVIDYLNGLTASGIIAAPYNYIIDFDGVYYRAVNEAGILTYGGSEDEGEVDGTDARDVLAACVANDTRVFMTKETYTITPQIPLGYPSSLTNFTLHAAEGTVLNIPAASTDNNIFALAGLTELSVDGLEIAGLTFDTTNAAYTEVDDYTNAIAATGGTLNNIKIHDCKFFFTQIYPAVNYFSATPLYLYTEANNVWVQRNRFINYGLDSVVPIKVHSGSNLWVQHNYFKDCNNPVIMNTGEVYKGFHYDYNNEEFSDDVAFPCEGIDLEGVDGFTVTNNTQVFLGDTPAHAGGMVIASYHPASNGVISGNQFANAVAPFTMTLANMQNISIFGNHNSANDDYPIYVDGAVGTINPVTALAKNVNVECYKVASTYDDAQEVTSTSYITCYRFIFDKTTFSSVPNWQSTYIYCSIQLQLASGAGDIQIINAGNSEVLTTEAIDDAGWQTLTLNAIVDSGYTTTDHLILALQVKVDEGGVINTTVASCTVYAIPQQ